MNRYSCLLPLALCILTGTATAEDGAGSGPDMLLGAWTSPCDAWGTPADCRLEWSRGLHPIHLRVDYTITAKDDGNRIFAGSGTYRVEAESLDGYWAGSNGAIHPLHARWKDGVLTTHWGTPATEQGRSEYRLVDQKTLHVTDWVLTPSGWRQFMRVEYQAESVK